MEDGGETIREGEFTMLDSGGLYCFKVPFRRENHFGHFRIHFSLCFKTSGLEIRLKTPGDQQNQKICSYKEVITKKINIIKNLKNREIRIFRC